MASNNWYKNNNTDQIWWLDDNDVIGEFVFSFDKKKRYNLFADYPHNMSAKEVAIFDKENPFWVDFFADRR